MAEEKSLKEQLEETQQALKRTERQLEKSQSYNEELRQQIETLSAELHSYRNAAQHRLEVGCQVEEKDIAEGMLVKMNVVCLLIFATLTQGWTFFFSFSLQCTDLFIT